MLKTINLQNFKILRINNLKLIFGIIIDTLNIILS
jgi:hypothetical protein